MEVHRFVVRLFVYQLKRGWVGCALSVGNFRIWREREKKVSETFFWKRKY